ncbi:PREDICTED: uncharacterized protein LOC105313337 [Amphimedon queenslandica]|uniref:tRNA-intron lyase n=1 Tax=Amphimedon queenslandica TaxID=400682 RepID=A0A1X7UI77_AMPQE|nr:PREDICTED: uncharacterized protein LOC105313337 [Amphimedon queenslandica]|eukprot:XP_011404968.1 PREDICTED: uncharacterized protein LOC105313337 [Amphimedon queenslandica]
MSYIPPLTRHKKRSVSVRGTTPPSQKLSGTLIDNEIHITDPVSIEYLSSNGCFGNNTYLDIGVDPSVVTFSAPKRICSEQDDMSHTHDSARFDDTQKTPSLKLSLVEVLYLMHTFLIEVTSLECEKVSFEELWKNSEATHNTGFLARYIAYYHLRKSGWVPRCGLKFGAHFLLYKKSPAHSHSTYAVLVMEVPKCGKGGKDGLSWQEVMSVVRVNESAGKEVILCYVTLGAGVMERREIEQEKRKEKGEFERETEEGRGNKGEVGGEEKSGEEEKSCEETKTGSILREMSLNSLTALTDASTVEFIPVKRTVPHKIQRQQL